LIFRGERDEVLATLPELTSAVRIVEHTMESMFHELAALWYRAWREESQKSFALKVKEHPFSSVLFRLRRDFGADAELGELRDVWRDSGDLIVKKMFANCKLDYDSLG
jgi:hypothetical protein